MTWHQENILTYFRQTFLFNDQLCTFISESGKVCMNGNKMVMTTIMALPLRFTYEVVQLKQWKLAGLDGVSLV